MLREVVEEVSYLSSKVLGAFPLLLDGESISILTTGMTVCEVLYSGSTSSVW
ncbi:12987_t:CDS:1, partial [Funneliformis geosporum]